MQKCSGNSTRCKMESQKPAIKCVDCGKVILSEYTYFRDDEHRCINNCAANKYPSDTVQCSEYLKRRNRFCVICSKPISFNKFTCSKECYKYYQEIIITSYSEILTPKDNSFINNIVKSNMRKLKMKSKPLKNRERALKAWDTMRKRGYVSKKGRFGNHIKQYDAHRKNEFREQVIKSFKKITDEYTANMYCLALESPDFLFVKKFNSKFIIVEHNLKQYNKMCKSLPSNIEYIYHNDLSIINQLPHRYFSAYLDFCGTFQTNKKLLQWIKPTILSCRKLALTFCLRGNKKKLEDYKFDFIKKLQELFPDFELEFAQSYRDGAPMIGVILNNKSPVYQSNEMKDIKNEIMLWCKDKCKEQFGHELYEWGDPIINPRASVNRITNLEKCKWLFEHLPNKYIKSLRRWSDYYKWLGENVRYNSYSNGVRYDNTLFNYFVEVIS